MAINFNQNSAFNLTPIEVEAVRGEVNGLLRQFVISLFLLISVLLQLTYKALQERENHIHQCHILKFSFFLFKHQDLWN